MDPEAIDERLMLSGKKDNRLRSSSGVVTCLLYTGFVACCAGRNTDRGAACRKAGRVVVS